MHNIPQIISSFHDTLAIKIKDYIYNYNYISNNQVLRKIKIVVKSDVENWAYISLR